MDRAQHDPPGWTLNRDDGLVECVCRHLIKAGIHQRQRVSATYDGPSGVLARSPDRLGKHGVQAGFPQPFDGVWVTSSSTSTSTRCSRTAMNRPRVRAAKQQVRAHDHQITTTRRHGVAEHRGHRERGADGQQGSRYKREAPPPRGGTNCQQKPPPEPQPAALSTAGPPRCRDRCRPTSPRPVMRRPQRRSRAARLATLPRSASPSTIRHFPRSGRSPTARSIGLSAW